MPEWVHTLTVDASWSTRGITGIGIVVQERQGQGPRGPIVAELSEAFREIPPGAGEAFAILRALEVALDHGFSRVKIRSDYNYGRRKLRQLHRDNRPGADPIQARILQLTQSFAWIDFRYVPRRKNQLAHQLARAARLRGAVASEWDDSPPRHP